MGWAMSTATGIKRRTVPYPTVQGVGAALKRAGFNRSEPMSGPRSLLEHTAGYKIRKSRSTPAHVDVFWLPCSLDIGGEKERRARALLRYADTLLAAGFRAQLARGGGKLVVYGRRSR